MADRSGLQRIALARDVYTPERGTDPTAALIPTRPGTQGPLRPEGGGFIAWGPGTRDDALAWADREQPEPDSVEHLDRLFFLQAENGEVGLPRHPDVAAGLADRDAGGTWYAVRADYPGDALAHVRRALAGNAPCATEGPCKACPAETVGCGTRTEVMEKLRATGVTLTPVTPPDVCVPLHPLR